jgi:hypothetical protein
MKIQPLVAGLVCVNLALVLLLTSQIGSAASKGAPVLRGSALELVDGSGQIRARFDVQPDGEVILRLLDAKGTIRVKLGASADGSGLLLLNDATEPGVQILAKASGSTVRVKGKSGKEEVLSP